MERIYFDKQIFSYLFKGDKPVYRKLLTDIYTNKSKFLFCYSHGHLLDLKNDKTDIKYKELDFIETIVEDNYLSYHATEKRTSSYLAKPSEAFKDVDINDEPISFSTLFDDIDLNFATPEQKEQISLAKYLFTNQKIDFGFSQIQDLPTNIYDPIKKILPVDSGPITLMEWTEHFMGVLKSMENDRTVYRDLRNVIDQNLNNGKFTVDYDSIDFNDDLKNSELKKSFIEYVNSNINSRDKEVTDYDFFTNAYFTLDLLGISKEPSKKVKFNNVMNDSYHSYYGAFCDYVVSDDDEFLRKTKALYKLLGIESKVYHVDEFIKYFALLTNSFENDSNVFFELLINDLKNGIVLRSKRSIKYNRHTTVIKPYNIYLRCFNIIENINEDGQAYILLRRKTNNYSYFSFYREYEGLINEAVRLFGPDNEYKGEFIWDKEIKEMNEGRWEGRFWQFDTLTILIEINKGINEICLLITPIGERE